MLKRKSPKAVKALREEPHELASETVASQHASVEGDRAAHEAPESSSLPPALGVRRVLAICEDLEGALRVSSHLATLQGPLEREDLDPLQAVARLGDSFAAKVDLVLFAPTAAAAARRPVAQELVELAVHRAGGLVVLLAPEQAHGLVLAPVAEVVVVEPAAADPVVRPRKGFLQRLFSRSGKAESGDAPMRPVEAATGPLRLISLQSLAGGAGSTTLASLLAAELAAQRPDLRILLIDLDLQFGQIAAYLDLKDDGRITDLYSGFSKLDLEAFRACLKPLHNGLQLLAAPPEILPLDALDQRKMLKFLTLARDCADLVILDLPHALPEWMAPIWREADLMVWVAETGLRSSHSYRRTKALTEGLAFDPRRSEIWLNRLPPRPKGEEAEAIESLRRAFAGLTLQDLPEGGAAIREAQTQGICPRSVAARSALVEAIAAQGRRLSPRLSAQSPAARNKAQ